ncbi:hypothetical protein SAURM35S_07330 [Streptomyces aurantiogriseus]
MAEAPRPMPESRARRRLSRARSRARPQCPERNSMSARKRWKCTSLSTMPRRRTSRSSAVMVDRASGSWSLISSHRNRAMPTPL